jgi:DNA-binding CsgD family transcriptional regulator
MAKDLADLVGQVYQGGFDRSATRVFLRDAADFFRSRQSFTAVWPLHRADYFFPACFEIKEEITGALFAERFREDTLFASLGALAPGHAIVMQTSIPAQDGCTGLQGEDDCHACPVLAGVIADAGTNRSVVVFLRSNREGEYSSAEAHSLRKLMGHWRSAMELHARLARVSRERNAAQTILDNTPRGILILQQDGRINYANMAAQNILAGRDGIERDGDTLEIDDDEAQQRFAGLLQQLRHDQETGALSGRYALSVPKISKQGGYQIMMYGLPLNARQAALGTGHPAAVMLLYDPDELPEVNVGLLMTFYGFTRAEAQLANLLYRGENLAAIAQSLNVSINTTRTHLRNIFKKVGVNSQAGLVQRISGSPRPVRR